MVLSTSEDIDKANSGKEKLWNKKYKKKKYLSIKEIAYPKFSSSKVLLQWIYMESIAIY